MTTGKPHDPMAILERIENTYSDLLDALCGLSDEDLLAPGMTGNWRGKDVLAHIARWEETAISAIQHHLRGQCMPSDYREFEAWNAKWAAEDYDMPLAEVRQRFEAVHRELMNLLSSVPSEEWDSFVQEWVKGTTWDHYPEHTVSIMEWRKRRGVKQD